MSSEMLAVVFGIGSAVTWGAGDFSGGLAARQSPLLTVIFFSQIIGWALLMTLQLLFREAAPSPDSLLWGATAGIFGVFGLGALYRGLALGRMGMVAPMSAVITAMVPMSASFLIEGLPTVLRMAGFGAALIAVWLLSSPEGRSRVTRQELILSLLAGLGFGFFFICIDRVSHQAVIWPLVAARMAAVIPIAAILMVKKALRIPKANQLPIIALAGILDTAGNGFFALASQLGRLDVSAVLASMYPASTVVLAWWLLRERIRFQQWFGVLTAMAAMAIIAA